MPCERPFTCFRFTHGKYLHVAAHERGSAEGKHNVVYQDFQFLFDVSGRSAALP